MYIVDKGVGDAHSSEDERDNKTLSESRGISSSNVFKERSIFQLTKKSNLRRKPKRSEMSDEERVRDFQRKLYLKAKQEKEFRFYSLYDKIPTEHILRESYRRVKANGGSPGVDGITFGDIEKEGLDKFIEGIKRELETFTYKPHAVKRVMIPKANGKMRPLGIPTIKDRVVQMSCKMVIEPIFEADFEESSYGFRPKRSSKDAMKSIKKNLQEGRIEVYDADLQSYFDTIPHEKLLITIAKRISDKKVLHLIKQWLKAPIEENGKISGGKKNKVGVPQGGVISPLLSNIYLHLLDRTINKAGGLYRKLNINIVRYADDFVLLGKKIPEEAILQLREILARMEVTLNEGKSKLVNAKQSSFEFLGFSVRYDKDIYVKGKRYWNIVPSAKSQKKIRNNIKEYLSKHGHSRPERIARELNAKTIGWINYFTIEKVSYPAVAKRKLRWYLYERLNRYYKRKSQRKSKLYSHRAFEKLTKEYGLVDPTKYKAVALAKA